MRLINADALHRVYMSKGKDKLRLATVINELEMQKTIDAVPVVHGRWTKEIKNVGAATMDVYYCSKCSNIVLKKLNYCSNCGAKMDLEVDGDGS